MTDGSGRRTVRSYVRRGGRITKGQERALTELSPVYCIPYSAARLNVKLLFDGKPVIVEIGFGMGLATAEIAEENPTNGYLGIEVFEAGVGKLLSEVRKRGLDNIRVIRHDAVEVVRDMIPSGALEAVHVFFPDPWPKKRHHRRRLIQRPFMVLLADRLRPGGYFHAVTDWADYARQIVDVVSGVSALKNPYGGFAPQSAWRPITRFERKAGSAGRVVREIHAVRVQ